jgi:hypothetical protein
LLIVVLSVPERGEMPVSADRVVPFWVPVEFGPPLSCPWVAWDSTSIPSAAIRNHERR